MCYFYSPPKQNTDRCSLPLCAVHIVYILAALGNLEVKATLGNNVDTQPVFSMIRNCFFFFNGKKHSLRSALVKTTSFMYGTRTHFVFKIMIFWKSEMSSSK